MSSNPFFVNSDDEFLSVYRNGELIMKVEVYETIIDGVPIVDVTTGEDTGHVRIFVNDGTVFDRDPEK